MRKIKYSRFCVRAVAVASALFLGMTPVTAFAYVNPEETVEEEEIVPEEPEEKPIEEYGPLTPDGNMELVDDYGTLECGGKQFITVVTKSGNYFYIIIDRDDDGNENVHFLNMVDERDLLSLMDEDEVKEYKGIKEEKEKEPEPEPVTQPEPEPEPAPAPPKKDYTPLLIALPFAAIAMIAGFFAFKQKQKQPKEEPDPDADYVDEEDDYLNQISEEDDDDEDDRSDE